jgi:pimeloyl-ACP methyl ester carboxylesterase
MARKRRQELAVESADGTRIGYTLSGAGPSLLLVHGTAVDHRSCVLLESVLGASRRVALMDRRGRGLSRDGSTYSLAHEADDVLAVIAALDAPVHVVGLSFGGLPVLEAAARSDGLTAVTLVEPPIRTGDHTFLSMPAMEELDRLIAEGRVTDAARLVLREGASASVDELRQLGAITGDLAAAEAVMPVTGREFRVMWSYAPQADALARIKAPVTVLVGSESEPRFLDGADALVAKVPAIRKRVLPGLSHFAPLSTPVPLAEAILESAPA